MAGGASSGHLQKPAERRYSCAVCIKGILHRICDFPRFQYARAGKKDKLIARKHRVNPEAPPAFAHTYFETGGREEKLEHG